MQKPRIGIHQIIADLIEAIGEKEAGDKRAGIQIVADFLGKGRSTVYKWTDPDQEGEVSFKDIGRLAEHYRISIPAEHLAHRSGGLFVKVEPDFPSKKVWHQSAHDIGTGTADALGALMLALADDGDVDEAECKAHRLRPLVRAAMTALATLDLNLARVEEGEAPDAASVVPMKAAAR